MTQISQHVNSTNHKIHSYDKMSKMIVNLGSNKDDKNDDHSPQLSHLQNSLHDSSYNHMISG